MFLLPSQTMEVLKQGSSTIITYIVICTTTAEQYFSFVQTVFRFCPIINRCVVFLCLGAFHTSCFFIKHWWLSYCLTFPKWTWKWWERGYKPLLNMQDLSRCCQDEPMIYLFLLDQVSPEKLDLPSIGHQDLTRNNGAWENHPTLML